MTSEVRVKKRRRPLLWEGTERIRHEEAREEKEWAETAFLGGVGQVFVGKCGGYELLGARAANET
jgi:hypothetical protein